MKEKWNFEKEKIERKNRTKKSRNPNLEHMWDKKWNYLSLYCNTTYIILFLQYFFVFYITNITQYIVVDKFLC